ncbi:MAG TPA: glycosyltransferase family 4 protein [Candidatus Acidoferrales bacterium]|nr:glycosyltransferase family 4 protein [Candidatus Acidoferrales bacterium]
MDKTLTIFVPHCSELLTDHLPHGDGLTAHGFITHLARRGHRLHVAVQSVSLRDPLPPNVTLHSIPLSCSGPIWGRLEYMARVRSLLSRLKRSVPFDLVHQLNPVFAGVSLALIGSGLPLILGTYVASWPHTLNAKSSKGWVRRSLARFRDGIARLQQRQADALLLTTPAASNRLPNPVDVCGRVHFLPHGIDTERFSPGPSASGGTETQSAPAPILFLANVVEYKGIFTLIEAFPAVAREFAGIRLRIAGDGNQMAEAKRRASRLPCASQVEFLGRQERADAPALYRSCSVYCLPSFGEPYGGTLVEAMSCGKAVVVTDAGGPPHIVLKEGALFVPVGDSEALSKALIEVLRDPARREAMGRHNRQVVEASMSWERVTARLESIYQTVLSGRAGRGRAGGLATADEHG